MSVSYFSLIFKHSDKDASDGAVMYTNCALGKAKVEQMVEYFHSGRYDALTVTKITTTFETKAMTCEVLHQLYRPKKKARELNPLIETT